MDSPAQLHKKQYLNVLLIGHVDAGKSTIRRLLLGQVDDRTIQRKSWYMADMYTNEAEIVRGRARFETEMTRFTLFNAPDPLSYDPNIIGASQADIGVLVISARKGEFEYRHETRRQTHEHVQLAITLGVSKLLVVVNKMDDTTVNWSKGRYVEIVSKMIPFLKSFGYNVEKDIQFLPISGLMNYNMKTRVEKSVCPWWSGPCLIESLDTIEVPERDPNGQFRMPIIDKFTDNGTVVMGRVESGCIHEGDHLLIMPNKALVKVLAIFCDEDRVVSAGPGENLRVALSGVKEEEISSGVVLCSRAKPTHAVSEFIAQLRILELKDNEIFTAGFRAVLHIHAVVEESEITELLQEIDRKTKRPMKRKPFFVGNGAFVVCRVQLKNIICIEKFSDFLQLGRFTLRNEGKILAVGKVERYTELGDNAFDKVNP